MSSNDEYVRARNSQLNFYQDVPLYKNTGSHFVLYKPVGITLGEMRVSEGMHPGELFIKQADKLKGLQEAQKGFNRQLTQDVASGDPARVKETLVLVVEETLSEPRSGSLEGVSDTVGILVSYYSKESNVIKNLIDLSSSDYTSALHSINVMAITLGFAFYCQASPAEAKNMGLCALLHDVGKTKISNNILTAPRRLSDEEFEEMKRHSTEGFRILKECMFGDREIALCALNHHEKIDGSGYPHRKRNISRISQVIGLIDCYEALTNDDRPYRSAMDAFHALGEIIKKDVMDGKFSPEIFTLFVKSLGKTFT